MPWPTNKGSNQDKIYIKAGETIRVRLLEDSCHEIYHIHFVAGKNVKCSGEGCEHCAKGTARSERGVIRVFDLLESKEKDLPVTPTLSKAIQNSVEMCGGRLGFDFFVKAVKENNKLAYYVQGVPSEKAHATASAPADQEEAPF